jgi:hypothetical protein
MAAEWCALALIVRRWRARWWTAEWRTTELAWRRLDVLTGTRLVDREATRLGAREVRACAGAVTAGPLDGGDATTGCWETAVAGGRTGVVGVGGGVEGTASNGCGAGSAGAEGTTAPTAGAGWSEMGPAAQARGSVRPEQVETRANAAIQRSLR